MDWNNIVAIVSLLVGSTGIYGWYKARPEKISFEIKNLREVIEVLKKEKEEDKLEAAAERQKLERRLGEIELTNSVLQKAVQQWFRCIYLPKDGVCPVSNFVDEAEGFIKKKVEDYYQSKEKEK